MRGLPPVRACLVLGTIIIIAIANASVSAAAKRDGIPAAVVPAHPYATDVAGAARRFALPERWIWAVMQAESRGDRRALSRAGAMGLMQIMPATWATLTARYALGSDPYGVRANIHAGAAYLREMLDRYGDFRTALAAYNAGPGRVDAWRSGAGPLPAVTFAYVQRIALAIDGSTLAPAAAATVAPPVTWRTAALFTTRSDGASRDPAAAVTAQPIGNPRASPRPLPARQELPAHRLFMPRSGGDAP